MFSINGLQICSNGAAKSNQCAYDHGGLSLLRPIPSVGACIANINTFRRFVLHLRIEDRTRMTSKTSAHDISLDMWFCVLAWDAEMAKTLTDACGMVHGGMEVVGEHLCLT